MNIRFLIPLIFFNCLAITVFAGKGEVAIKGTITNPLADSVTFAYVSYDDSWLDFKTNVKSVYLDKNGKFAVSLPVSHDYTGIQIQNGEQATELFASPGDKLEMTVNAADFDASLEYEGNGTKAGVANFSAKHVLTSGFTQNYQVEMQKAMGKEPAEFIAEMDKMLKKEQDFLVANSKGLPQSFIKFWDASYTYNKYFAMLMYAQMHEVIKKQSYDIGQIPAENFTVTKQVPEKFDDKLIYIDAYRNYIREFYTYKLLAEGIERQPSDNKFMVDKSLELTRKNMPVQSEQYVYASTIAMYMKTLPVASSEESFSKFNTLYGSNDYTKFLEKRIADKKKLSIGSPAIDFPLTDADGKKMKLSDLKGKVVYVDFWASWCGPCKKEFPYSKKLKEHFAGKDVVFVYVSIDEDEAAWKSAMEKYELTGGLHTRVNGWADKLAKEYSVNSIPAYFLIDKEGKFASDKSPRPSQQEELVNMIEALL